MRWFEQRLRETADWCARRADPARPDSCLRTPALMPAGFRWPPRRYLHPSAPGYAEDEARGWGLSDRHPSQDHGSVEQLAERRRELLAAESGWRDAYAALRGGRILAYDPGLNLFDGAAEQTSEGFFDVDNVPPWDTWLCFVLGPPWPAGGQGSTWSTYLLSFIPQEFVACAADGIAVNPEQCIVWASDLRTEFVQKLRLHGLSD